MQKIKLPNDIYDIIIVGAGPAGLTAGIYSKRAETKVAIVDPGAPGGKMVKTSDIMNYPGFENILGSDLSVNMFLQNQNLNVPLISRKVVKIKKLKNKYFAIYLDNDTQIYSYSVIVATGTIERLVGAQGEKEFYGKGVSNCAVCDGAFYKDDTVMVIGGGYAALEEGIYLTKFAKKVIIVHRRQGFRADKTLVAKAKAHPKIEFILDAVLEKVNGIESVESATICNVNTNKMQTIPVKAVFPFIGSDPVTNFLLNLNVLDENGYMEVDNRCETKIIGLFGAGDATNTTLRQIATAISDGAKAAQFAIHHVDVIKE